MTKFSYNQLSAIWEAIDFKIAHLEGLSWRTLPFVPPNDLAAYNRIIDNVYKEVARLNEAKRAVSKVYEELLNRENL